MDLDLDLDYILVHDLKFEFDSKLIIIVCNPRIWRRSSEEAETQEEEEEEEEEEEFCWIWRY